MRVRGDGNLKPAARGQHLGQLDLQPPRCLEGGGKRTLIALAGDAGQEITAFSADYLLVSTLLKVK